MSATTGLALAGVTIALATLIVTVILLRRTRTATRAIVADLRRQIQEERLAGERQLAHRLTEEVGFLLEQERKDRHEQVATSHEDTVAEVARMIEAMIARSRTDIAWQVAEATKAVGPGGRSTHG